MVNVARSEPTVLGSRERPKSTYGLKQLPALLAALHNKQASGVLCLETEVRGIARKAAFILDQGRLVFGGKRVPSAKDVAALLTSELGGEWTELVLASHTDAGQEPPAPQAILSRLVMMHLLTWDQVETTLLHQLVIHLEPFLPRSGYFSFKAQPQPPIAPGFNLNQVMTAVNQRQSKWAELVPYIHSDDAIPGLSEKALQLLASPGQRSTQEELYALQGLQALIDGQRSMFELAAESGQDPLLLGARLLPAFRKGWLVCDKIAAKATNQPTILAVDDSALMRQLIQRVLGEQHRVLGAATAMEALGIISREEVQLILLDVTMPGIDGLELCRSIRKMSKFKDLPIIMVTSRDGLFDRVKGRISGATEYLTKPFDREHLRQVVCQYLSSQTAAVG